jgi:FkbM family methyltransferase
MARCVGRAGRVHAFEPLPRAAARLREEVAALEASTCGFVTVHEAALSCQSGRRPFIAVQEAPEYSGLRRRRYDCPVTIEQIEIDVHTLDDYADRFRNVAYIKIDVEGAELEVLQGARFLLARDRPVISFEFGDNSIIEYPYDSRDMFGFLSDLGYSVIGITGEALDLAGFVECSRRQHIWDYLAYPQSRREAIHAWVRAHHELRRSA